MIVEVLLFASLKDAAHADRISVSLSQDATVADLLHAVSDQHPALSRHLPHCRVAVNREYARNDEPVQEGDEIALLPPVSGG
jgi:molybdopterin converting factor subunit 1